MRISYCDGQLTCNAEGDVPRYRPFDDACREQVLDWARRYESMVGVDRPAGLTDLGREIFRWLDGNQGWLGRLDQGVGHRSLEFAAGPEPDEAGQAFLDVPWEILANDRGFLAADPERLLVISRRLGDAGTPFEPGHADLLLMFMAAQPEGSRQLDYDREEAGILRATERLPLHLRVEESGCLDFLVPRLALEARIEALHLSCHGTIREGEPVLMLEDAKGFERLATPLDLVRSFGDTPPPLVFLSACRTAEQHAASPSLAMRLVRAGVPNVIGWDGSVYDDSASAFARCFYAELGRHQPIPFAAARARADLLRRAASDPDQVAGRHWHMARVYLGPAGGGAVSAQGKTARPLPKNAGFRAFLDKEGRVPVASAQAFVGRRREAQKVRRAFDDPEFAGVLIHGMGRQGKSSLAARIANRLPTHETVAIFKNYQAERILAGVLDGLPGKVALKLRQDWMNAVAQSAQALEEALREALSSFAPDKPLLLIIDDLERILHDPEPGRAVLVEKNHRATLIAVIRAFRRHDGGGRLLFTSRYRFVLADETGRDLAADLFELPLPEMNAGERRRQLRAELTLHDLDQGSIEHADLFVRASTAARGNAGLQSLLTRSIVTDPALAGQAIDEVEAYHRGGQWPEKGDLGVLFQKLTLSIYKKALTPEELSQLRAGFLFERPVPHAIMIAAGEAALVAGADATLDRLIGLGLVEAVDAGGETLSAVNALARPLFEALSEADRHHLAKAVAEPLAEAWRDKDGELPPGPEALEVARLAELADLPGLHGEAATIGATWLYRTRNMAREALDLLDPGLQALRKADLPIDPHDIRLAVECADRIGDSPALDRWLTFEQDEDADPVALAMLQIRRAERDIQKGDIDSAERYLREAAGVFKNEKDERSIAITQGKIADILVSRGELDEALRIRTEEQLPVYTRLGDVRSIAITQGKIADILVSRGELDEALRIRTEEELPVHTRLGDVRSIAITQGQIADILVSRGELDEALRIRTEEELPVYSRLGDVREIAITQGQIADILVSRGELDEALRIRTEEELPVYSRLGDVRSIAITQGQIADILVSRGELDEALRIRTEEELPVHTRLGDVRSIAITQGKIADILVSRGELDEARRLQEERLSTNRKLQDPEGVAAAQWDLAQISLAQENRDDAIPRIEEAYGLLVGLGRVDGIAIVGSLFGRILVAGGATGEARSVFERSILAARKLGMEEDAADIQAMLDDLGDGA